MSIETLTCPCVVVSCDRCDEKLPYTDEGSYAHYESEQEAREAAQDHDWFISDNGLMLCLSCIEDAPYYEVECPNCEAKIEESCGAGMPLFCEERIAALAAKVEKERHA